MSTRGSAEDAARPRPARPRPRAAGPGAASGRVRCSSTAPSAWAGTPRPCWRPARPRAPSGIDRDTEALDARGGAAGRLRRPLHLGARGVRRAARGARRPRPAHGRRRALRPRGLLAAARRGRPRLRLPPRRAAGHADGPERRHHRGRRPQHLRRRRPRRGSCATTARSGSPAGSPPPSSGSASRSPSPPPPGWSSCSRAIPAASQKHRRTPRQAHLPGAADRGQRRAGGLGERPARRGGRARRRRPDRRAHLPLPGGPADQAACSPGVPAAPPRPACRSSCPSTRRTCGCSRAGPRSPARTRRT